MRPYSVVHCLASSKIVCGSRQGTVSCLSCSPVLLYIALLWSQLCTSLQVLHCIAELVSCCLITTSHPRRVGDVILPNALAWLSNGLCLCAGLLSKMLSLRGNGVVLTPTFGLHAHLLDMPCLKITG